MVNEKKVFGRTKQQFMAQMLCAYQGVTGAEAIDSVNRWESWFDKHASDVEMNAAPNQPGKPMIEARGDCDNCRDGALGGCGNCAYQYCPQDVPEPEYYAADLEEVVNRVLDDLKVVFKKNSFGMAINVMNGYKSDTLTPKYIIGLVSDL